MERLPHSNGDRGVPHGFALPGGFASVFVDGKQVAQGWGGGNVESKVGRVHLEQGKKVAIKVNYAIGNGELKLAQLIWSKYDPRPSMDAIEAART